MTRRGPPEPCRVPVIRTIFTVVDIDGMAFGFVPARLVAGDTGEWKNRVIFRHTATRVLKRMGPPRDESAEA